MKRRGGAAAAERTNVVASDVADKELSDAAKRRIADKAVAEAAGTVGGQQAAQPLPVGMILVFVSVLAAMLYITLKFS